MRRKDREIKDRQEIIDIMRRCEVVRIALNDDGYPYIVPLNFGMTVDDDQIVLYFHSALEGHKVDLFRADDRAAFEMDCGHELRYTEKNQNCTFAFESVMGRGRIGILPDEEKFQALQILMDHYYPGQEMPFSPAAVPRTLLYKLTVEEITGKRRK